MDRLVEPKIQDEAAGEHWANEGSLRPRSFLEFIGQPQIKNSLELFIKAARERKEALDHVLFAGPPGLGKTTLAHLISKEMNSQLHVVAGPNLERKGDLAALLTNLNKGDVLFIDEIHRLYRPLEEVLYSAMEDRCLDIILGQGGDSRTVKIDLQPFTLVGATTRTGLLSSPLRDRFGITLRMEFYSPQELTQIVLRSADILNFKLERDAATEIARRSRGTPRIANRLLRRVRDFIQVKAQHLIGNLALTQEALKLLDVDEQGLDAMDRKLLLTLIEKFDGGPVGVETLSFALGDSRETLEDIYEPYLVQEGFLLRTPRGRVATPRAFKHLSKE